jgi:hypothetical protein
MALTMPVDVTVATAVFDEVQGVELAAVPDPVSVVLAPAQSVVAPLIVGGV